MVKFFLLIAIFFQVLVTPLSASPEVKAYLKAKLTYAFGKGSLTELEKHLAKIELECEFTIDLVKQESELLKRYRLLQKGSSSLAKTYFAGVLAGYAEVATDEFCCHDDAWKIQMSEATFASVLLRKHKANFDRQEFKVLEIVLRYFVDRVEFSFEDAATLYEQIKDARLKKDFQTVMAGYLKLEYHGVKNRDQPSYFRPFLSVGEKKEHRQVSQPRN